jgi:large subunit ribosomal protein L10
MSKPIKSLITHSYQSRFADVDSAVLIDIRGVGANDTMRLRQDLAGKQIRVTVVKNSLARTAFKGTALEELNRLLEGPNAMVYGGQSVVEVARELITIVKQIKEIEFKGAIMEGMLFGPDEVEALSKYPTREEAIAQTVQIFLSPAQNLVGAALGPGRKIASLVKAVEEKLEKGETIKA